MCGINGIIYSSRSGESIDIDELVRMRDVLHHRGPDESGIFVRRNVGLAHRRLSIVDLKTGQQPMQNDDGSCVVTYNGEIFNHNHSRSELIDRGYQFKSSSDTETLLHLYEEFGADCLEKLRGMFAFAIWDDKKQELFVARDRFGVKPLYYFHAEDGSFYFASEIKSLLESRALKAELNFDALPDQFANHGTSAETTLFRHVKRLLPGHYLIWKNGEIAISKYWDLSFEPKTTVSNENDLIAEWFALFEESVKLRMMSDVPLGMFLSGGIDSSAIAMIASQLTSDPLKTFSVGFTDGEVNEFGFAKLVSDDLGTEHHEIAVSANDFFRELPNMIWHEDEPIGFEASVPLYFVSTLAQKHVKVVLTGEGSDETLAGYGRYSKAIQLMNLGRRYEAIAPGFVRGVVRTGVAAIGGRLDRTFLSRDADVESLFFDNFSIFNRATQRELFTQQTSDRIAELNPYEYQKYLFESSDAKEILDRLLYSDIKTYMHELLMKQDQMSMAASIESRVPFLDHKLVEFASRLPIEMKLRRGGTKWILRQAMKNRLPDAILNRPKMGFPVPLGDWLRGPFRSVVDDYVLSERAGERGIFNRDCVRRLVKAHDDGRSNTAEIFKLINFEMWYRIFIEKEDVKFV